MAHPQVVNGRDGLQILWLNGIRIWKELVLGYLKVLSQLDLIIVGMWGKYNVESLSFLIIKETFMYLHGRWSFKGTESLMGLCRAKLPIFVIFLIPCETRTICWALTEHSYMVPNSVILLWKMYHGIRNITKIGNSALQLNLESARGL
jgi:hypothetical protein